MYYPGTLSAVNNKMITIMNTCVIGYMHAVSW